MQGRQKKIDVTLYDSSKDKWTGVFYFLESLISYGWFVREDFRVALIQVFNKELKTNQDPARKCKLLKYYTSKLINDSVY